MGNFHKKTPQLSNWCYWNTIGSRATTKVLIDLIQKHQRLSTRGKLFRIISNIGLFRLHYSYCPPFRVHFTPSFLVTCRQFPAFDHFLFTPVIRFRSVLILSKYSNSSKHCSPTLRRVMLSFKHNLTKCI